MGNNRANIITIKVTSDHVVKNDIAVETVYCITGDSSEGKKKPRRSDRPKSWNLQVPSSDVWMSADDKLDSGLGRRQQRPRSTGSQRQRHLSSESCRSTISDSALHIPSRNSTMSKAMSRSSSSSLHRPSESFGSSISIKSVDNSQDVNTESFYLRVPGRPTSCNSTRSEGFDIDKTDSLKPRRSVSAVRPKSWCCSMRETNESVATVEDSSKSYSEQSVKPDGVLDGKTISHFYKIWNISSKDKVLGRGKLELPNSLKRQEKYRPCGCPTRHHVGDCKNSLSSTP